MLSPLEIEKRLAEKIHPAMGKYDIKNALKEFFPYCADATTKSRIDELIESVIDGDISLTANLLLRVVPYSDYLNIAVTLNTYTQTCQYLMIYGAKYKSKQFVDVFSGRSINVVCPIWQQNFWKEKSSYATKIDPDGTYRRYAMAISTALHPKKRATKLFGDNRLLKLGYAPFCSSFRLPWHAPGI